MRPCKWRDVNTYLAVAVPWHTPSVSTQVSLRKVGGNLWLLCTVRSAVQRYLNALAASLEECSLLHVHTQASMTLHSALPRSARAPACVAHASLAHSRFLVLAGAGARVLWIEDAAATVGLEGEVKVGGSIRDVSHHGAGARAGPLT